MGFLEELRAELEPPSPRQPRPQEEPKPKTEAELAKEEADRTFSESGISEAMRLLAKGRLKYSEPYLSGTAFFTGRGWYQRISWGHKYTYEYEEKRGKREYEIVTRRDDTVTVELTSEGGFIVKGSQASRVSASEHRRDPDAVMEALRRAMDKPEVRSESRRRKYESARDQGGGYGI